MKSTIVLGIGATLLASCSGNRQKAEEKVTQQQKKPNACGGCDQYAVALFAVYGALCLEAE